MYALLVGVQMSVRYHDRRRSWFAGWHNGTLVCTAVSAGGMLAWLDDWPYVWVLSALMGISVATNLVFRFADRAAEHHALANRFRVLEKKLTGGTLSSITEAFYRECLAERQDVQADEPASPKRLLSTLCQYELLNATRTDLAADATRMMSKIKWWRRALAPVWSQAGFVTKELRGLQPSQ